MLQDFESFTARGSTFAKAARISNLHQHIPNSNNTHTDTFEMAFTPRGGRGGGDRGGRGGARGGRGGAGGGRGGGRGMLPALLE